MSNILLTIQENRKVTFRMGENETEIDFVTIKKEHRRFTQNVKEIHGESQQALMIADIDHKKMRKVVRKTCREKNDKFSERHEDQEAT